MGMDGYNTIFSSDLERTCFVCLFLEGKRIKWKADQQEMSGEFGRLLCKVRIGSMSTVWVMTEVWLEVTHISYVYNSVPVFHPTSRWKFLLMFIFSDGWLNHQPNMNGNYQMSLGELKLSGSMIRYIDGLMVEHRSLKYLALTSNQGRMFRSGGPHVQPDYIKRTCS